MDDDNQKPRDTKRTDVGYKRPPVEHQFKVGQKPPPRKPRAEKPQSVLQSLAKILAEERRLTRGGKAGWYTNGYLLVEVAFQLAEKGSSVVTALAEYLMAADKAEVPNDIPLIELDPDAPGGTYTYVRRVKV